MRELAGKALLTEFQIFSQAGFRCVSWLELGTLMQLMCVSKSVYMTYVILVIRKNKTNELRMKTRPLLFAALMCAVLISSLFLVENGLKAVFSTMETPSWLTISGLVENPLNLTYASLWNLPLLSEVATLQCVGGGQGGLSVTYNWTGVPLFYLLSMTRVMPGAYRKVVFNATDGFSSSIPLATAMDTTTMLGLEANGTDLKLVGGLGGGYRIVLPCRWGYKWVSNVKDIIVVDYDYKGTYERIGFSDEALRPNCTVPPTIPPIESFTAANYSVHALTNSLIKSFNLNPDKLLGFDVSGLEQNNTYFYVAFPEELMQGPYQVYVDHSPIGQSRIDANGNMYVVFTYANNASTVEIVHTSVNVTTSKTVVGLGYTLSANCTVRNEANLSETLNVTLYVNSTSTLLQVLTLQSGGSSTLIFTWNTTSYAYGKYDVSAMTNATQAETGAEYNTYIDGTIFVTIPGDVNGDGKVRIDDILAVSQAFGSNVGDSRYRANLDINSDQRTRVDDVLVAAQHFGQGL